MSLKTWKKEFYPISALQASKTLNLHGLIDHALRKWEGLRHKALDRHGMFAGIADIYDESNRTFEVDASTCSLCRRFVNFRRPEFDYDKDCIGCPIFESRGQVRCFEYHPNDKTHDSPYHMFTHENNPEPMIKTIIKAKKWAEKQGE